MLIGVDHGNKQIKTVHCNPFVSGLQQSITKPFGQSLQYRGNYYTLSNERIPFRKDKTEDDRFFVLTLIAIAEELETRHIGKQELYNIQLPVGLPPAHFGAQAKKFTDYFKRDGIVEFVYRDKPYAIRITDVVCYNRQCIRQRYRLQRYTTIEYPIPHRDPIRHHNGTQAFTTIKRTTPNAHQFRRKRDIPQRNTFFKCIFPNAYKTIWQKNRVQQIAAGKRSIPNRLNACWNLKCIHISPGRIRDQGTRRFFIEYSFNRRIAWMFLRHSKRH